MTMRRVFEFPVAASVSELVDLYSGTKFFIDTMKLAGARSVEMMEDESPADGTRRWKARMTEALKLPEFLMISDRVVIMNESVFHPLERRLDWRIMPSIKQSFIQLEGRIHMKEQGPGARLVYEVFLDVKIPVMGKKTESVGLQLIGRACADQARFAAECVASTTKPPDSTGPGTA
jgi:hypothetical protein